MDSARHPPPVAATDAPPRRPLAVVTPLFPHRTPAWTPVTVEVASRRLPSKWLLGGAVALALLAGAVFHSRLTEQRVSARLATGCLDVDDCRGLVHAAEAAEESCWIGCASHADLVSRARGRFRGALEQAAHRERRSQDEDYERALRAQRETDDARRDREHQQRLTELDQQHRQELALIAAETERLREEKRQLQQQRLAYLQRLSREQKLARLRACHRASTSCDDLAVALFEAAASVGERAALVDAHERHVTGQAAGSPHNTPAPAADATPAAPAVSGISATSEAVPL